MTFKNFKPILLVWFYLVQIASLNAIEIAGQEFNFSLSQTYYQTSTNEFLIENSDDGTFQWTEGVVNTLKTFEQLQIGAQLLVRDFGQEGNFRVDLDWGYADYAFNNFIGVRLGRMRLPFGLGNEYRDVDAARMEILMPQVFNPEEFRSAAASYHGLGLYGTFRTRKLGSVQYQAFWGNNTIHDDFFIPRQAQKLFNSPSTKMNSKYIGGLQLTWHTPYEGLKFSYSNLNYKGELNIDTTKFGARLVDDRGLNLSIIWHLASIEFNRGPWTISAEYLNRNNNNTYGPVLSTVLGTEYDDDETVSFYLRVRRQITEKLGIFVSYGELYSNIADDNTSLADMLKENSYGFRYDIRQELIFKTQLSHMRGYRGALNGTTSEDWLMFMSRLTLTF